MIVINSVAGRIAEGALPNAAIPYCFCFLVNKRIFEDMSFLLRSFKTLKYLLKSMVIWKHSFIFFISMLLFRYIKSHLLVETI